MKFTALLQIGITLVFVQIFNSFPLFGNDSLKVGIILRNEGYNKDIITPTSTAIEIALKKSPLNYRKYLYPNAKYWRCEENKIKALEGDNLKWQYPIKICYSEHNTVLEQKAELVHEDSVLLLIGLPSSSIVGEIFTSQSLNTPVISSVATASKFTIKSRNDFKNKIKENQWLDNHKWFFRATSPDLLRIEALYDWIDEERIGSCYVLYGDNIYGRGLRDDFQYIIEDHRANIRVQYESYCSSVNQCPDDKKIEKIITKLRSNDARGIESIVLFGYSRDDSYVIKKIKEPARSIPIFVVEPNISKENKQFWGKEFNNVRALSAQILWNGDYEIKQFTEVYTEFSNETKFVDEQIVPLGAGFAYDATVMMLTAIYNSIEKITPIKWDNLSSHAKKEMIRQELTHLNGLPMIMSNGQITQTHDALAKLQRCYIKDNQFYLYTEVPTRMSLMWVLLLAGGCVGGISRVILFINDKLKSKSSGSLVPKPSYILASVAIGAFGAVIIKIFWNTTVMHEILPKFFDQFSLQEDPFIVGFLGGLVPTAIIAFFTKRK